MSPHTSTEMRGAWRIVAQRELMVKLRDRGFVISTVVTLAVIVGALAFSAWMGNRGSTVQIASVGAQAGELVQQAQRVADQGDDNLTLKASAAPDRRTAEQQVRDGKVDVALVRSTDPSRPGWQLIGDTDRDTQIGTLMETVAGQQAVAANAAAAGTSIEQLQRGGTVDYQLLDDSGRDPGLVSAVTYVLAFLTYLASILFGMTIAQSVVEEKQNRIVEILASAIPVRQLLFGKIAGNVTLAVLQLVLYVGAGLIGLAATGRSADLSAVSGAAAWFVAFFVVGFLAQAAMWAVAGSLATRNEDLQSTATPMTMTVMIVLFAGLFASGTWQVVASYVPLVSVVAMPARLMAGTAAWWEPIASLALMVLVAYVTVLIAERLYRRALMQTSGKLKMRQAWARAE